jgi:intracellular septation protein
MILERMMKAYIKFFFEILPLAVFFTVNSVENIQIIDTIYHLFFTLSDKFLKATFFLVLTSLIAIPVAWYIDKKVPWMPIVTGVFVLFFGSLTLFLQDPDFIKLKPTIINIVFASILLIGLKFNKIFLKIAFQAFKMDDETWKKLTLRWSFFFIFLAVLNEIVWRNFNSDQWIFFKVWIIFPLTMLFMVFFVLPLINKNIKKIN